MIHTYKVTFKEGTTNDQIKDLMERIQGTISRDFEVTTPIFYLETERQPMDLLFGPQNEIIEDLEMIGFMGETI